MLQKTCMRNHATTARRARVTLKGIVAASQSPRQNRSSCATRAIHRDGAMVPASHRVARQVKASPPKAVAEGASGERTASANTGSRYVVVTGASSGLGLRCAADLARNGDHHVVMACRDFSKAERMAKEFGMPAGSYTVMHLDLGSLTSVREFVDAYKRKGYPIDALVCNAAVYLPTDPEPSFTADGYEASVGINHLGHFLLCHLLIATLPSPRTPRHHRRVRDREHEHSGGPGSAAGGFGRPPRPWRGTGRWRERDD